MCAKRKGMKFIQGTLYLAENHLCFRAKLLTKEWKVSHRPSNRHEKRILIIFVQDVLPLSDITEVEKKTTAVVIPNAIQITTAKGVVRCSVHLPISFIDAHLLLSFQILFIK
jgi:hypothetical protein